MSVLFIDNYKMVYTLHAPVQVWVSSGARERCDREGAHLKINSSGRKGEMSRGWRTQQWERGWVVVNRSLKLPYSYQYHKGASQTPTQHSLHNSKTTTVQGGPRVNNARPSYQQQMHLQQSPVAAVTASCEMAGILQNINTPALC